MSKSMGSSTLDENEREHDIATGLFTRNATIIIPILPVNDWLQISKTFFAINSFSMNKPS